MEFDPPEAIVPDGWDSLWDPTKTVDMKDSEKAALESMISEIFSVVFVQNSDEDEQRKFSSSITEFTSAGLSVQLDFSDPLLVSHGDSPDEVTVKILKSFFTETSDFRRRLQDDDESQYHEFYYDVPKQVKSAEELASLESTTAAAQDLIVG